MKKKILVIRLSSIGDVVLTTPVLRVLKTQAEVELHVLTKPNMASLLANNPHIDQLLLWDAPFREMLRRIRKAHYHRIIDLHSNLRTYALSLLVAAPMTHFPKCSFEKWLLVRRKVNRMPQVHVVDRYFCALQSLGLKNDRQGLELFLTEDERAVLGRLPEGFRAGNYLAVAVGSQHATKVMPRSMLEQILRAIQGPVILLGTAEEAAMGAGLIDRPMTWNACGDLTLMESAAVVSAAKVVLSGDTGLMHMAAAFNRPMASVWGSTVPAFGMWPYYPKEGAAKYRRFEVIDLPCRPCSHIGFETCPQGHFHCMRRQDTAAVVRFINDHLKEIE